MELLIAVTSSVGVVIVAVLTLVGNIRKTRIEAERSPYEALAQRVVAVEAKLADTERELAQLRAQTEAQNRELKRWFWGCEAWAEFNRIDLTHLPTPPDWLCHK